MGARSGSPEADLEIRLKGRWFVKDVLLAATGKAAKRTGKARVWFQARSQAQPGQQGALEGELDLSCPSWRQGAGLLPWAHQSRSREVPGVRTCQALWSEALPGPASKGPQVLDFRRGIPPQEGVPGGFVKGHIIHHISSSVKRDGGH